MKEDWHYAFVCISEDSQHILLSDIGHISILADGAPSRNTCGWLSQLEVHKLLHLGGKVVYPEGLNGVSEPVWVTLPKLPIRKVDSTGEAILLQLLMLVSSSHSVTECPSEIATTSSMMEEIEDLLSSPMFAMPGEPSMHTSPRRPPLMAPNSPAASRREVPPEPGETLLGYLKQPPPSPHESSKVGTANVTAHSSHSPSPMLGIPERDTSPTPIQSQANSIYLLDNVLHLQEEMNDVTVHLLTARALIDTHCWSIISEAKVSHCQNEINLAETIREVKAKYTAMIGDAESAYATPMRKAEAAHSASTSEVEVIHATGVRKTKAASAVQAGEAFSPILSVGLWSGPSSLPQLGSRETVVPSLFIDRKPIPPWSSNSNLTTDHKVDCPGELPLQRQREEDPLAGHMGDSYHEAFCKDWDLGPCIR